MPRLLALSIGTLGPLILLAPLALADWWIDDGHLLYSTVAALLCYLPAVATMTWCLSSRGKSPDMQVVAMMGGTGIRMAFVVAAGMALYSTAPAFDSAWFWLWIVSFYLWTLAVEVILLATRPTSTDQTPAAINRVMSPRETSSLA